MKLEDLLQEIGLTGKEAKVYLALLSLGECTIKPIADRAGIKRTSIYNFIDRLIAQGLVTRSVVRSRTRYAAANPTQLLTIQRSRIARLDEALPKFMDLVLRSSKRPSVRFYQGSAETKNIVLEELTCKKEALYIWTGREMLEMVGGAKFMNEVDRQRIERGIRIRTIRFRDRDVRQRYSAHGPEFLRELRWAPRGFAPSMGVGIYDTGKVAFLSSRRERFGVVIESREIEELMRQMYEYIWRQCEPGRKGEG